MRAYTRQVRQEHPEALRYDHDILRGRIIVLCFTTELDLELTRDLNDDSNNHFSTSWAMLASLDTQIGHAASTWLTHLALGRHGNKTSTATRTRSRAMDTAAR